MESQNQIIIVKFIVVERKKKANNVFHNQNKTNHIC